MKKLYQKFLTLSMLSLLFFSAGNVMGQALIEEDFDYGASAGDLTTLGAANWSAHSGATGVKVNYLTTSLSLSGYASSGVAGSISISGSGAEDVNYGFTSQTSGTVYMSALVNLSSAGSSNYFMHFNASGFVTRIATKSDGATGVNFGVGTGSTITYGATSYNLNTTYLLVASYDIATGVSNLYILSAAETVEPANPEATSTGTAGSSITAVSFRQSGGIADVNIDGVRVATSWEDLIPVLCTPPTTQATAAGTTVDGDTQITLDWTRGDGDNVLVVAKKGAAVDAAPVSGTAYTADAAFGSGDDLGNGNFVVYKGTATSVPVTALSIGTEYHFEVFEYNNTDVCYLTPGLTATATTTGNALPTVVSTATAAAETTSDVVLSFSETINATDATGISISIGGVAATINNTTGINSATWTFTLAETITANSGEILISYDDTAGDLADVDAAPVTTFTDVVVTNNATLNIVTNLLEARAITSGELVQITGEIIVTHVTANSRDQIFVQDATAGILIDDSAPVIAPGTFVEGDGIVNFKGVLGGFGGITQIVPAEVPAVNSSANVLTPIVVSIADFNAALDTYESRLLKFENVTFPTADGTLDFGTPTSDYSEVSNGVETTTLDADGFLGVDYSTTVIPFGRRDLIALGRENNGTPIITPRSSADIIDNYAPITDEAAAVANITTSGFDVTIGFDEPASVKYLVNTTATATQGDVLASADMVTQNDPSLTATINLSGLADNTQYYVHMVAMDASGDNPQAAVTTVDATTVEIIFDATSDIIAADAPIGAATISAATNLEANAVDMFNFKVTDDNATDTEATTINTIVIKNNNAATWSSVLAGASITDGTTATAGVITDTEITFDASAAPYVVTGGGELTFTLSAWLTSDQTDGTELSFTIPTDHAFQADAAGSVFKTTLSSAVTSATHTIDVVATELVITGAPTTVLIGEVFGFSVAAEDDNGNVDTAARQLSASTAASGVLGGTLAGPMTAGVYTYADLTYDTEGTFTVSVTDGALTATTATITASATATGTLFFSEYIEGNSNNRAIEIYNGTGADVDLSNYTIKQSHNGVGFDNDVVADAYALPLSGTLAAGDVYIIYNDGASLPDILAEGDLALTYGDTGGARMASFTGDDALGLFEGATLIDLFGDPTVDPGSAWDVAGVAGATANKTLVRKPSITEGNTVALGSFGTNATDSEWIVYDVDVTTYLGFFGELTDPTITATTANFNGDFGYVVNPSSSAPTSYTVSAVNLSSDLVVSAPAGFELSLTSDFASASGTLTIVPVTGTIADTEIFVRFTPTAADGANYGGDITHVAAGATTINLAVSGIEGELALSTLAEARVLAAGALVRVTGIVTTPDYGFSNGQYYIQDATGGINIFHSGNQGLVSAGDSVEIEGNIAIFNSLVEIEPTMVSVISSNNDLPAATSITEAGLTLDQATQGTRVVLQAVSLVNEAEWPLNAISAGSSLDVNALVGTTNFIINIDRGESFYDGSAIPPQPFTITGVLTRAGDNVLILPFYDGEIVETVFDPVLTVVGGDNGFDFGTIDVGTASAPQSFTVAGTNLAGDILVTAPAGYEVSESEAGTYSATISAFVDQAGEVTETTIFVRFAPSVVGTINGDIAISTGDLSASIALTGTANEVVPTANKSALAGVTAYPNPTNNSLFVDFAENNKSFNYQVFSLSGAILVRGKASNSVEIKLEDFQTGIYMLEVKQGDKVFRARIAKH